MSTRPAIAKLARTLHVPAEQLDYLADVSDADLVTFRRQVADMLFGVQAGGLRRIAAAARILPVPVIAKLVKLKPNALLTARTAGVMDAKLALDVGKRMPAPFLAEVAAHLDSERAQHLIADLPTKTIVEVAKEIAKREDWITLADLFEIVPDDAARAAGDALDEAALRNAAQFVDPGEAQTRMTALLAERGPA